MALTKEQFLELRKKGLSVDQIVKFEKGEKPQAVLQREEESRRTIEAGKKAEEFLKLPWYKQILTTRFVKEIPKAAAKIATEVPARTIRSLAEAPETILRGGGVPTTTRGVTSKLPFIGKATTYQEEARKRAGEIVGGEKPLYTALTPFVQVPLEVWQTAETGKKLVQTVQKVSRAISTRMFQKEFNTALDTVMEQPRTKAEKAQALLKGEAKKTKIGTYQKLPNERDVQVAASSTGIVKGKDAVQDIKNLQNNVSEVAEKTIKPFLQKNSYYLTKDSLDDLASRLAEMEEPSLVYTEATLSGAKGKVTDVFMKIIKKNNPEDTAGLWESLKEIDRTFQSQFGQKVYDTERINAVKNLYLNGRRVVQDFIVQNTPAATDDFRYYISLIHDWKTAESTIATKNAYKIGASWFKLHPTMRKVVGGAKIGGGIVGSGGIGYSLWNWLKK